MKTQIWLEALIRCYFNETLFPNDLGAILNVKFHHNITEVTISDRPHMT